MWQCPSVSCSCRPGRTRQRQSLRSGSFFAGRHLQVNEVLIDLWELLHRSSQGSIKSRLNTSRDTVRDLTRDFYLLIEADLRLEDMQIGKHINILDCCCWYISLLLGGRNARGERIVVEIDESKFGKCKYNVGHHVEGIWVIGGVEKTPERKAFLAVVPQRNAATLTKVITRFIKPESLIYSDCWRAYSRLEDIEAMQYIHEVVNHSIEFVTESGVHTNSIEG